MTTKINYHQAGIHMPSSGAAVYSDRTIWVSGDHEGRLFTLILSKKVRQGFFCPGFNLHFFSETITFLDHLSFYFCGGKLQDFYCWALTVLISRQEYHHVSKTVKKLHKFFVLLHPSKNTRTELFCKKINFSWEIKIICSKSTVLWKQ